MCSSLHVHKAAWQVDHKPATLLLTMTLRSFVMELLLVALLALSLSVKAVQTPDGCPNPACDYVEQLAATCQDTPQETQNNTSCL
jgi:hypothetical protein